MWNHVFLPKTSFIETSASTATIQQQILLLEAGVPLVLTPQEQTAIAAFLATTVATTAELTTTTAELTTTTALTTTTIISTTTTVTTTTTTPYPCSGCAPIYDASCQGLDMPSSSMYCLTDSEVPVTYTRGFCSTPCLSPDACMLSLGCPSGTAARIDYGSGDVDGNADGSPTFLYCDEGTGTWNAIIDGSTVSPVSTAACRYPHQQCLNAIDDLAFVFRFLVSASASRIQLQIRLLEAGVPLVLTPQEQAAIATFIATSEATPLTDLTTTTALTTTTTIITTTVNTTTVTTNTKTPYPCSTCAPLYDTTCQGLNMPSSSMYCLTADEVPIEYSHSFCSFCGSSDACLLSLDCPSGTSARLDDGSGELNGNSDGTAKFPYCDEPGGSWTAIIDGSPVPVTKVTCRYP
ncbi:hypothetical protein L3Y34_007110 [Caenorhabditis briggsae]|uniref:Uncharacterized protein n=1 Tax=Caenorhabditis briggsae TaxID=6238 RepID=A0AAE9A0Z0_CAEBR|nr:hypothetical protein L3Y34_007110 [Caenorhabditis briggsae]